MSQIQTGCVQYLFFFSSSQFQAVTSERSRTLEPPQHSDGGCFSPKGGKTFFLEDGYEY